MCGLVVFFHYRPKEIICPTHGRIQETIPWASEYARITYRVEYLILMYAQMMSQKDGARLLALNPSTFSNLLHAAIERIRSLHNIRGLRSLGVDEIAYKRGKKYATLVYDLDRGCVVWIGKGKGKETINDFFTNHLSVHQRKQIKWASCDMAEGYINAIKEHCPDAKLVIDRFHIVKALNTAMDEVRKEEWRSVTGERKKVLKGLRWLLFMHSSNRTKADTLLLKQLNKSNRHIYRAWVLKDEFEQFWDYKATWAAERFLKRWITTALKSRLEPIRKFARTIKKHFSLVMAFIERHLTNAAAEGLNRVIKLVKNRASGFRSLEAFSDLIYLQVGDVDIPARIPLHYRTI